MPHIQRRDNDRIQRLLYNAFYEAISFLGQPVAQTMLWHLQNRGVISQTYRTFDIDRLDAGLREILGSGSDVVMEKIYENLARNWTMNKPQAFEKDQSSKSYLEKIYLLEQEMEEELEN